MAQSLAALPAPTATRRSKGSSRSPGAASRDRASASVRPYNIPVAYSDFIFAAIGEELGLLGTTAVVVGFLLLVGAGIRAALRARSEFSQLAAVGFTAILGFQSFFIMAGVLRLLPLTGVSLPFIGYGGSSLLANYVLVALLMRISDEGAMPQGSPSGRSIGRPACDAGPSPAPAVAMARHRTRRVAGDSADAQATALSPSSPPPGSVPAMREHDGRGHDRHRQPLAKRQGDRIRRPAVDRPAPPAGRRRPSRRVNAAPWTSVMRTTSSVMPNSSSTLVNSSWVSGRGVAMPPRRVADRDALGPADGDPQLAEGGVRLLEHDDRVGGRQEQHDVDEEHLRHLRGAVHRSCIEHRCPPARHSSSSMSTGPSSSAASVLGPRSAPPRARGRPGLELVDRAPARRSVAVSVAGPGRLPDGLEGPAVAPQTPVGCSPSVAVRLAVGGERRLDGVFFRAHGAHRLDRPAHLDIDHEPDRSEEHDHGGATVAYEGKRDPRDGYEPDGHADVLEHRERHEGEGSRAQQPPEGVPGDLRRPQQPQGDDPEQGDDEQRRRRIRAALPPP